MANIPKIKIVLYPHFPKIDPSIPYPFKYLQKYPASLYVFGQYPRIPKNPSRAPMWHFIGATLFANTKMIFREKNVILFRNCNA